MISKFYIRCRDLIFKININNIINNLNECLILEVV